VAELTKIGDAASRVMTRVTILSSAQSGEEDRRQRERDLAVFRATMPPDLRGKRFADFDPDPDRDALQQAKVFAAACGGWIRAGRPDDPPGPVLFLTSQRPGEDIAPGNGKSLLACATLNEVAQEHLRVYQHERTGEQWPSIAFVTATDFLDEVRACYGRDSGRTVQEVIGKYLALDLLAVDDVGTEGGGDDAKNRFFALLDKRKRPILFTSNYTTKQLRERSVEWAKLVSRMRQRMRGALLTGPDRREPETDPWKAWL
jgi:hypothetical protein